MISMLVIQSIWDCRYGRIPIAVTLMGGLAGLGLSILHQRSWVEIVTGVIPGLVCLLAGWATREAIGYGDGYLLCAMGMYLSWGDILGVFMIASFLAGVLGVILLILKKKRGTDSLPFVPFLLMGAIIYYMLGDGGVR